MAKTTLLLLLSILFALGCGPKTTNLAPDSTEKTLKTVPDWFLDPPQKSDYLFATASMTSKDMQLSIQKAKTVAQADLAQQLETRMGNLTRQFREEVGEGEDSDLMQEFTTATKAVTDQTLNGVRLEKQLPVGDQGVYRSYVLMSIPIGKANKQLMALSANIE